MNYCSNCKVTVLDERNSCPLCHKMLEEVEAKRGEEIAAQFGTAAVYPNVRNRERQIRFFMSLMLFCFILCEGAAVVINLIFTPTMYWSAIVGIALLYTYLFVVYWIRHDAGAAFKVGLQIFSTMALLLLIDHVTGNRGWAVEWAIPGLILLGDGMVFFFMMLNRQNWYSYLALLLLMVVSSAVIMLLYVTHHIHNLVLPVICMAVSGVYLAATILFGDRQVKREFRRRFHV
ncbi:MAG: hypothetical protein IJ794_19565 [Lachnospiraceae bacterium]|nr:hypothetical protein [Lachnospiraceae bacterium]